MQEKKTIFTSVGYIKKRIDVKQFVKILNSGTIKDLKTLKR